MQPKTAVAKTPFGKDVVIERIPNMGMWRLKIEGGGDQPASWGMYTSYHRALRDAENYVNNGKGKNGSLKS